MKKHYCFLLILLFPFITPDLFAQMSGTYTINAGSSTGGSNFASFSDATSALSTNGVSGSVVINVVSNSGPYIEQVRFDSIPGTDTSNTVTVNGNGNVIKALPSSTDLYLLQLNNVRYLHIKNLTFYDSSDTYGWGCHVINDSRYNTVEQCVFDLSKTNNTNQHQTNGIVGSFSNNQIQQYGATGSYNIFKENVISGGPYGGMQYGINFVGTSNRIHGFGNQFIDNQVLDFYSQGIRLFYSDSNVIAGNDISRPNKTVYTSTSMGIQVGYSNQVRIYGNKIHGVFGTSSPQAGSLYGFYITSAGALGKELLIYNNLLYDIQTTGSIYCMANSTSRMNVFHNTFSIDDTTVSSTGFVTGMYFGGNVYGTKAMNNNISITRKGSGDKRGIIITSVSSTIELDGNNIYLDTSTSSGYFGHLGLDYSYTLEEWQKVNSGAFDQHSTDLDPQFVDAKNGNLKPTSFGMNDQGVPVAQVVTDINGFARNALTPDAGAYEYTPQGIDVLLSQIVSPFHPCPGTDDLVVNIRNNTDTLIDSIRVHWSVNQNQQTTYFTNLGLSVKQDTNLLVGNITLDSTSAYDIRVWLSHPNGKTDNYPANDTIEIAGLKSSMVGTYSVGTGMDYASLLDITNDLNIRGVCGNVVINVDSASGPYDTNLVIGPVYGAGSSASITFNGNGAVVQDSTDSDFRIVVEIRGTPYLTWDNFHVNTLSSTNGYGITLSERSDYCTISNNHVDISSVMGTGGSAGIATYNKTGAAAINHTNHSVISNNVIKGGVNGGMTYGILVGGDGPDNRSVGNVITGNTIMDAYGVQIYLTNNEGTLIKDNDISRPNKTSFGSFYGIYAIESKDIQIFRNKVHDPHASPSQFGTSYGIAVSYTDSSDQSMVFNNLIYRMTGRSARYGLYNSSGHGVQYYHNTVSMDDPNAIDGTAIGFYVATNSYNVRFKNNIISITDDGNTNAYGMHINSGVDQLQSDYNDVHVNAGGSLNAFTRFGSSYLSFKQWQQAGSGTYDQHSDSLSPIFDSIPNNDFTPTNFLTNNLGTPIPGVQDDFFGNPRNALAPDAGAIEYTPIPQNDSCQNALPLTNGVAYIGSTAGANPDTATFCVVSDDSSGGVWFKYQSTGGFLNVSLCGSDFDTRLRAFKGNCGNLVCVDGNEDSCSVQSNLGICSDSAETYFFLVYGNSGEEGLFKIQVSEFATIKTSVSVSGSLSFCSGDSVLLTSSSSGQYLWNDASGSTSQSLAIYNTGNYFVATVDSNGCRDTSSTYNVTAFVADTAKISLSGPSTFCSGSSVTLTANTSQSYLWNTASTGQQITVTQSGIFQVITTDFNGCSDTSDPVQVTVHPATQATITPTGPVVFCKGDSVILLANLVPQLQWTYYGLPIGNGGSVVARANGPYVLSTLDGNGCSSSDSVFVTVHPIPIVDLGNDTTICTENTITLDAGFGHTSYLWSTGAQSQSIFFFGSTPGIYTISVQVTNSFGCSKIDQIKIQVTKCVGIDEISSEKRAKVFPVPANHDLFIELNEEAKKLDLDLFDLNGRLAGQWSFKDTQKTSIHVDVPVGTYLLRINVDGHSEIREVIFKN